MPRNGSGQYVLPPLNPVQPDTIITTAWGNSTLDDIAAALSTSISTDGQTTPTANLPMGGWRHTNVGNALALNQYASASQVQGFVFNIVTNVQNDAGRVNYTGTVPFNIGVGAVGIPTLMPLLFVPSANNGGPAKLAINGGAQIPILNSDATPLFADQITAGRPYALVYTGSNWILITNTLDLSVLNAQYLRLAGGTMLGALTLSQDPSTPSMAATKNYVDLAVSGSVAGVASFNTRTGAVNLLSSDVTSALSYVPANIAGAAFTGNVTAPFMNPTRLLTNNINLAVQTIAPSTGNVTINGANFQNFWVSMTGNMNITIDFTGATSNPVGNITRIMFANTTGKTITFTNTIFWPGPSFTAPPALDTGPAKHALYTFDNAGGGLLVNYTLY